MPILMNAHPITFLGIIFSLIFTNIFWFFVLPLDKARRIAVITSIVQTILITACLFNFTQFAGKFGGIIVLILWVTPSLLVWIKRDYFYDLNQKNLVALQIFRLVGSLFILEMFRGKIPSIFALPAGIGDTIVGLTALLITIYYKDSMIPKKFVVALLIMGIIDFTSAIFFGFTSQPSVVQLFAIGFNNQTNLFPTGMIPFFLVPYAIVFHTLSFINLKESKNVAI
jgi:hypothetical protein